MYLERKSLEVILNTAVTTPFWHYHRVQSRPNYYSNVNNKFKTIILFYESHNKFKLKNRKNNKFRNYF